MQEVMNRCSCGGPMVGYPNGKGERCYHCDVAVSVPTGVFLPNGEELCETACGAGVVNGSTTGECEMCVALMAEDRGA